MKILPLVLFISSLYISSISHASIVTNTITFDPASLPNGGKRITNYVESRYVFTTPNGMTHYDSGVSNNMPNNGTAFLSFAVGDQPLTIRMEQQDSVFSLLQVDLAHYSIFFSTDVVQFIGHCLDGSTVFQNFSLTNGINFNSFLLNENFTNLLSVEVHTEGYAIDNVQVSKEMPTVLLPPIFLLLLR